MSKQSLFSDEEQQTIEQLQARYASLNTRKIQAETNRDNAQKRLDELQEEAREKYGTDDVEKLRKKLAEMTSENEKKRSDYQQALDTIESELDTVEKNFAMAEEPAAEREEPA